MQGKRNKLEIIRDILMTIRAKQGKIKPTHILYKSNLSHAMMKEYLDELIKNELIVETTKENSRTYSVTKKGDEYLEKFKFIQDFTESFGLG